VEKIRLRETPGTKPFEEEVACARLNVPYVPAGKQSEPKVVLNGTHVPSSVDWLVTGYKRRIRGKINDTLLARRSSMLEAICDNKFGNARCGDLPFSDMMRRHVLEMSAELRNTPRAQNEVVRALSAMFSWAVDNDIAGVSSKRDFPCALTAVAPLNRPRIGSDIRVC
jgi:hypothetical protein